MNDKDTLLVMAASYDDLADAEADYEAIKALYYEVKTSHEFDAAVLARDESGEVKVVKKHEQPTRHGAAHETWLGPRGRGRRVRSSRPLGCLVDSP